MIVLTYNAPHRKTQDLLWRLKAFGHTDVRVVATPWEERKNHKPLIAHRPAEPHWPAEALPIAPADFCRNLGYPYYIYEKNELVEVLRDEIVLIGGARILPEEVVRASILVNAHPAWIPYGRGLDSLKWCIYHGHPIGVTTHICDENVDAGRIIDQRKVPLYEGDTFHALAHRQYEIEMGMLVEAVEKVRTMGRGFPRVEPSDDLYPVTRRMPAVKEMIMLRKFEQRVLNTE